jgi:hypothetical protein
MPLFWAIAAMTDIFKEFIFLTKVKAISEMQNYH